MLNAPHCVKGKLRGGGGKSDFRLALGSGLRDHGLAWPHIAYRQGASLRNFVDSLGRRVAIDNAVEPLEKGAREATTPGTTYV